MSSVEKIIKTHDAQAFMAEMKKVLVNLLGDSPKGDGLVVQAGRGAQDRRCPLGRSPNLTWSVLDSSGRGECQVVCSMVDPRPHAGEDGGRSRRG